MNKDNIKNYLIYTLSNLETSKDNIDKRLYDIDILEFKSLKALVDIYNKLGTIPKEIVDRLKANNELKEYANIINNKEYEDKEIIGNMNYYSSSILEEYKYLETMKLLDKYKLEQLSNQELENGIISLKRYDNVENDKIELLNASSIKVNVKPKEYISSGNNQLDYFVKGFALGELNVWSGSNASAKSTFLNQVALESINQNYNVMIYSGELTKERLMQWLYLQLSGENIEQENGFYRPTINAMSKMSFWLDNKLFIYPNEIGSKEETIFKYMKYAVENKKVKVFIIDNLMSMELENGFKYDAQSNLVKKLSSFAKQYNVVIHFVCHPRKATSFLRKTDISGTADLTNIADNVFITHRIGTDFEASFEDTYKVKFQNEEGYSNVIEICKNREFGVQDRFCGMFYDSRNRRLKNYQNEQKKYNWEK